MKPDIFSKLKNSFPMEELPHDHETRFKSKLDQALHKNKSIGIKYLALAASIIAFLGVTVVIFNSIENQAGDQSLFSEVSVDMHEAEQYLQASFYARFDLLNDLENLDPQVLNDFKEVDRSIRQIEDDLKSNPGDERLIRAAFDSYQLKIEMLDGILARVR